MTKKEFQLLKTGDKVRIKKYSPKENGAIHWVPGMDKYKGKVCTILHISTSTPSVYFMVAEDDSGYVFHYKAIDSVVVGAVAVKHDDVEPTPEERIKQLEDEIKALKKEQKRSEDFEKMKKAGSQFDRTMKGLMAGGLSREEAFEIVKMMLGKFADNPSSLIRFS